MAFRWFIPPLTSPREMLPHPFIDVVVHRPHGRSITSLIEVVAPAFYLSVKLHNHFADGASVPASRGQLFNSLAFSFTRFGARHHRQERWFVSVAACFISKGVAKEVEVRPPLFKIYGSRLCPVDFKSHPLFHGLVDPVVDSCSHIPRHDDEVVGVANQLGIGPLTGTGCHMELPVEPVQIQVSQQWGDHSSLRRPFLAPFLRGRPALRFFPHSALPPRFRPSG